MKRTMKYIPYRFIAAMLVFGLLFALQAAARTSADQAVPTAPDELALTPAEDPSVEEIIRITSAQTPDHPILARHMLDELWDSANTAYINGDYAAAIHLYDSILVTGNASHKLYYNLGNAWFKEKRIGRAILYYNKALKLDPSDADTKYNLRVANTYVKNRIEQIPEFFLITWLNTLQMKLSSNVWAVLSLVLLAVALAAVPVYLLSQRMILRKIGFYTTIAALSFCIFAIVSAAVEQRALTDGSEGVVIISAAPVKSAPERGSKDIFVLHEGTKVRVIRSQGEEWKEISIADGKQGWILNQSIELIN